MKYKRSGDHYFHKIDKMPEGLKKIKHNGIFVFGTGEASNHNHIITVDKVDNLIIKQDINGIFYFKLKTNGWLKHIEGNSTKTADHKPIKIEPMIWRQVPEREVDIFSQTIRKVID